MVVDVVVDVVNDVVSGTLELAVGVPGIRAADFDHEHDHRPSGPDHARRGGLAHGHGVAEQAVMYPRSQQ